jgi:transcriptional regulator with XRE-family HTH domain
MTTTSHIKKEILQRKLTREDRKLAKRIKDLRRQRGMSQYDLSLLLGKNHNYISYIETGRRAVSLPMVYRIAKALRVSVKDLFDWEPKSKRELKE